MEPYYYYYFYTSVRIRIRILRGDKFNYIPTRIRTRHRPTSENNKKKYSLFATYTRNNNIIIVLHIPIVR